MIRTLLTGLAVVVVAGFQTAIQAAPATSGSTAYDTCQTNFTVVVLGSSTAAGAGATPITMAWVPRYRTYLQHISPNNQVINRAVGGYTTYNVMPTGFVPPAKRSAPDPTRNITYAISLKPNAIIVNLPTNDIAFGYSMEEITSNFKAIADAARAAKIPLWVTTPQPRNLTAGLRARLPILRDFINASFGAKALDFMSGLGTADFSLLPMFDPGDGTHPNNLGHALLFRRVVAAEIQSNSCAAALVIGTRNQTPSRVRLASLKTVQPLHRGKVHAVSSATPRHVKLR